MSPDYLKTSYQRSLWIFALGNVAVFWSIVVVKNFGQIDGIFQNLRAEDAVVALFAPIIILVLNGIVSSENKARLVYWRYLNPLPGSFAFSRYLDTDSRANRSTLEGSWGPLPDDPLEENHLWYRMFKDVENDVQVREAHRNSLFSRDLTAYAATFLVVLGLSAMFSSLDWPSTSAYLAFLVFQYLVLVIVARTYGSRFVCNVLALQSVKPDGSQ